MIYFVNSNQFDLLTHKMAWQYVKPYAFFFIYSQNNDSKNLQKNLNKTYPTFIYVNDELYFFDPNKIKYFLKSLSMKRKKYNHKDSIEFERMVDDDFLE